ncbi:MAG: AEC family transporter [Eubacteriales bacterium]|nr:AEC family transporter [Eubacteriales bacterium]
MFNTLINLMGMMFFLILTGYLLRRFHCITDAGKKSLTDVLLYAILPCNIIKAFSQDLGTDHWSEFFVLLVIALLVQALALLICRLCYRGMEPGEREVYQYATVCSNSGFLGNPMAEGVFGELGLLFASVFLLPQRVVMWTAGVSYFTKETDRKKVYRKILLHPSMIATYLGFAILIFGLTIPEPLNKAVLSLSNCTTAMTMVYIGTILVDVDFRYLVTAKQLYYNLIRLVLMPLAVYAGCRLLRIDPLITGVSVLLTSMPAGSTTSLLAAKYGADEGSAAKCVVLSTLLSIIAIPVWSVILLQGIG